REHGPGLARHEPRADVLVLHGDGFGAGAHKAICRVRRRACPARRESRRAQARARQAARGGEAGGAGERAAASRAPRGPELTFIRGAGLARSVPRPPAVTSAMEDYLKAIFHLTEESGGA